MVLSRLLLAVVLLLCVSASLSAEESRAIAPEKASSSDDSSTLWYDIQLLDVEGQGWDETKATYDRHLLARESKNPGTADA